MANFADRIGGGEESLLGLVRGLDRRRFAPHVHVPGEGGMANDPRVCVVGSSNIDLTFRTPRLPRPGETLAAHGFQLGFGGKGANQAVMAARLGARVAVVTKVGRDAFGPQTVENYRREGIDTTHLLFDDERPSGVASISPITPSSLSA